MIFKQLSIQHFKRLKNSTFDFKPGINIIKGENETGKSTIKLAFWVALFEKVTPSIARSIQTWNSMLAPCITLKFTTDDSGFVLRKDFNEKESILVDGKTGRKYEDQTTIQKVLANILGIGSKELFESTAYIDHIMVSDIKEKGIGEIKKSLSVPLTGANKDTSAQDIIKKLDGKISEMEKGLYKLANNPGKVKQLTDEVNEQREKLDELKKKAEEFRRMEEEYKKILSELSMVESELEIKKKLYEMNERYYKLKEEEERLKKEYFDIERKIKISREDMPKLNELNKKIGELKKVEKKVLNWLIPFSFGLLVFILSVLLSFINKLFLILLILCIPLFIYSLSLYKEHRETDRSKIELSNLTKEKEILEARIQANLGQKTFEELEAEEVDKRRKLKDIEEELSKPELKRAVVSQVEYIKCQREIEELGKKREILRERKSKIEGYLEKQTFSESEISEIEEILEKKESELSHWKRKLQVYKVTRDSIIEAFNSTLIPAKAILKEKISEYFKIITMGRYDNVDLDSDTLEFKVYSNEKNGWISLTSQDKNELSRGTIDQFYLSTRLALIDVISKGKTPPIFLDDPFVTFDDKRLERAMELLKKISKKNQVFIFTCKDTYDRWADNIVSVSL